MLALVLADYSVEEVHSQNWPGQFRQGLAQRSLEYL
jgi:hypothetical protein